MINCYEENRNIQKVTKPKNKTVDGKIIMDSKECYDMYSVAKGNVKCENLPTVMESLSYNNNKYTLQPDFKRDTTEKPKIRALKLTETASSDWVVGVM
jgi:hypothetical protein